MQKVIAHMVWSCPCPECVEWRENTEKIRIEAFERCSQIEEAHKQAGSSKLHFPVIAAIILTLLATPVFAAEFTTDERSALHVGASFAIGTAINTALIAGNANKTHRMIFTLANCMTIGAIKEFGVDAYPDYGDLAFDALGCGLALAVTEGVAIRAKKKALEVEITW